MFELFIGIGIVLDVVLISWLIFYKYNVSNRQTGIRTDWKTRKHSWED